MEKPKPEVAPSNIAVVGRYILTSCHFEKIENTGRGAGGEIQLTDAIAALMKDEQVLSYEFEGNRYDCGYKFGFLLANVEYGLLHPEIKAEFAAYLKERVTVSYIYLNIIHIGWRLQAYRPAFSL